MKICDVVKNSIWYDPRVRKQIISYLSTPGCEVSTVGIEDKRYDPEKLKVFPCEVSLVKVDKKYFGEKRTFFMKIKREILSNREMTKLIIAQKPEIIHANDLNALVPACKAAKKLKCKVIYDSHEVFIENSDVVKHKLLRFVWKLYEKRLVKRISKMVCVSNAAADYFSKLYKIEKPLVVTNCSLRAEMPAPQEKNSGFEVLNHGQFYGGRGYDIMIEALPHLKGYGDIIIAFRGFGTLEESMRRRAAELGDKNVRFYPRVLVEELIPEAAKSHVGIAITEAICLNFKLSVSNKLFEYASAGLPVIMSDIPEHRFLNEKYNFGIVISDNRPETLAEAIIKLYTDKELYAECSRNALRLSEEVCWEKEFNKLIEIERELLAHPHRA